MCDLSHVAIAACGLLHPSALRTRKQAMELLYRPELASENCYVVPSLMLAVFAGIGIAGALLAWKLQPVNWRGWALASMIGFPAFAVSASVQAVLAGESLIHFALGKSHLEYRYCQRLQPRTEVHSLAELRGANYRRKVSTGSKSHRKIIYHYVDLHFEGRPEPITVPVASLEGSALDRLAELAPAAVRAYRRSISAVR